MRKAHWIMLPVVLLASGDRLLGEEVNITPDVVYGHKHGLAMTFDVFTPGQEANGAGVLFMVSGGWYSRWSPPAQLQRRMKPLTDRGFTVFAVRHGSSPKFSIAEAVSDVRRCVRFIRLHADRFGIDENRIGVFGMSAGGHLSLMLGTSSDSGKPDAKDPVQRVSNRVQAVVAYVAPTDLRVAAKDAPNRLPAYERYPALDIDQKTATPLSPILHVTPDDPPTLLLVGAKDELVPVFHSERIQKRLEQASVKNRLISFPEAGHGFTGDDADKATAAMVDWFADHLSPDQE